MSSFLVGQKGLLIFPNWPGSLVPFTCSQICNKCQDEVEKDFWWYQFREIPRDSSGYGSLASALFHGFALPLLLSSLPPSFSLFFLPSSLGEYPISPDFFLYCQACDG